MTPKTKLARLKKAGLLKVNGEPTMAAQKGLNALTEGKLYLKTWSRSKGIYSLNTTLYNQVIQVLNALRLNYELGNDSPRNGAEGDYIFIHKSELKKLR